MRSNIIGICIGVLLSAVGSQAPGEAQPEMGPGEAPYAVQVIQPKIEVLERPVILEVQVDPSLGADTSMMILCATSAYRGEATLDRQDIRIRLSISGEIKELSPNQILVAFDVEAQSDDSSGGRGFAGAGGAILEPTKPKTVLTIGGRSLILTVRFAK